MDFGLANPCAEPAGCLSPLSTGFAVGDFLLLVRASPGAAVWPAANRALYMGFLIEMPVIAKQIMWENGATVAGNVDVGIYNEGLEKLVSSGSTAQSGTSVAQAVDITDTELPAGFYWLGMAASDGTATFIRSAPDLVVLAVFAMQQEASAMPLPTTPTFANPASAFVPIVNILFTAAG